MVALIEQNSNQILLDMKNIYEFRDIIDFPINTRNIVLDNREQYP